MRKKYNVKEKRRSLRITAFITMMMLVFTTVLPAYAYTGTDDTGISIAADWDNIDAVTEEPVTEVTKETDAGGTTVKVSGNIPENVELFAETYEVVRTYSSTESSEMVFMIEISLYDGDGQEWQPNEGETVEVTLDAKALGLENGEYINILHEHREKINDLGNHKVVEDTLTFETDGFSVFYGYTVDFAYGDYLYSMEGGSSMYLSELFQVLAVERSVDEVVNVEFSDPTLLSVEYDQEKEDWKLESLASFTTEETLTVTFSDSEKIVIDVTDALTGTTTLTKNTTYDAIVVSENSAAEINLNGYTLQAGYIDVNGSLKVSGKGTISQTSAGINSEYFLIEIYKNGSLEIAGESGDGVVIEGNNTVRQAPAICCSGVLKISNTVIQNFTVANDDNNGDKQHYAGAVYVPAGTTIDIDIEDSIFKNCVSHAGSAIMLRGNCAGNLDVKNTVVEGCKTTASPFGVATDTSKDKIDEGGAIRTNGATEVQATFVDCIFRNNSTERNGAAIYWNANGATTDSNGNVTSRAYLSINDCQFLNNSAAGNGGAIFLEANMEIIGSGDVSVENAVFEGEIPSDGLQGTLFTGNSAQDSGGAIMIYSYNGGMEDYDSNYQSSLTMGENILITNNTAANNGGGLGMLVSWTKDVADGFDYVLNIDGTEIIENTANGNGGGVYLENTYQNYNTSLNLKSGSISNNTANNGGGVYVANTDVTFGDAENASKVIYVQNNTASADGGGFYLKQDALDADDKGTITISTGQVKNNTANGNGGGIYQTGGQAECQISGSGSVSYNNAVNGGGFYIADGTMDISGGHVLFNNAIGETQDTATVDPATINSATAYASSSNTGVGGGIYLHKGSFTMVPHGATVSIYGNKARFAADDVYASPENTYIKIPSVDNMLLMDENGNPYAQVDDWYEDYAVKDSQYQSGLNGGGYPNGSATIYRYRYANTNKINDHKIVNKVLEVDNSNTSAGTYVCLTLGYKVDLIDINIIKHLSGNFADMNAEFKFTVVITPDIEKTPDYTEVITKEFTLSHGEEFLVEDIPVGAKVSITEDAAGYEKTVVLNRIDESAENQTSSTTLTAGNDGAYYFIASLKDLSVDVTNTKNVEIDTGIGENDINLILYAVLAGIVVCLVCVSVLGITRYKKQY